MDKKRLYSIIYLVCLVLLVNSLPFSLLIDNEKILFIIDLIIKIVSIIYIFNYIKKENLNKIHLGKASPLLSLRFVPFLLLCISNFFVVIVQKVNVNNSINLFNIFSGLITAVCVAIIEEILFRSQILEELLKRKSKVLAVIFSALIFGSVHLLNISSLGSVPIVLAQVCYTFVLGMVLGYIYSESKNILFPIIFHFLFNFLNDVLVVELFKINWDIKFYLVNIFIGILVIIYLLFLFKLKREEGAEEHASENMDN